MENYGREKILASTVIKWKLCLCASVPLCSVHLRLNILGTKYLCSRKGCLFCNQHDQDVNFNKKKDWNLFHIFFLTEKTELVDQEKWDNILRKIETNLRRDDFNNVLELVDNYLLDCKSLEIRLHALMTKVDCCFEAWKQTSKSK